jgi:HEAT repeat protein
MERAFASWGEDADLRRLLLDLAGRFEDPAARRLLLLGLDDPSPAVRVEAATAVGEGGFREALRRLLELKSRDPVPEVRLAVAGALRKLQPR